MAQTDLTLSQIVAKVAEVFTPEVRPGYISSETTLRSLWAKWELNTEIMGSPNPWDLHAVAGLVTLGWKSPSGRTVVDVDNLENKLALRLLKTSGEDEHPLLAIVWIVKDGQVRVNLYCYDEDHEERALVELFKMLFQAVPVLKTALEDCLTDQRGCKHPLLRRIERGYQSLTS